jgi:hypothetical protein
MTLNAIQAAVLELLHYYIERQTVARDVLLARRPDLLAAAEDDPDTEALTAEFDGAPLYGRMGPWQYSIHGTTITLSNTRTGEPIDWEPPDLNQFDRSAFAIYVGWFLKVDPDNLYGQRIREYLAFTHMGVQAFVYQTLEQFHQSGLLSPRYYNRYTLL